MAGTPASSVPSGGGAEIVYTQITTANVNIVSTTEATPTTIITANAGSFTGAAVVVEIFSPLVVMPAVVDGLVVMSLWEGATQITELCMIRQGGTTFGMQYTPCYARYRFTPTAGAHTYVWTAHVSSTTGTPRVSSGAGGVATLAPSFIRIAAA